MTWSEVKCDRGLVDLTLIYHQEISLTTYSESVWVLEACRVSWWCLWCKHMPESSPHVPSWITVSHRTPWMLWPPSSPCPNMQGTAFLCQFIIISQKMPLSTSASFFFFTRSQTMAAQKHTHTLRASVRRLYSRLFLLLNKECDPQWRDYSTPTKTLSQCLQPHALSPWLTQ